MDIEKGSEKEQKSQSKPTIEIEEKKQIQGE